MGLLLALLGAAFIGMAAKTGLLADAIEGTLRAVLGVPRLILAVFVG